MRSITDTLPEGDLTLGMVLSAWWKARKSLLAGILAGGLLAFFYLALLARPQYLITAIVGPAPASQSRQDSGSGTASVTAALASVTGIQVGGNNGANFAKFMQVLGSARLAETLETKYGVMHELIAGWDKAAGTWETPSGVQAYIENGIRSLFGLPAWQPPTGTRLATYLTDRIKAEAARMPGVASNQNQLIKLNFYFRDRAEGIRLLSLVLNEADLIVRNDQLVNTKNRVTYLEDLINQTSEITLREAFQSLLAREEQNEMTLRADKFYAIDMVDPPNSDTTPDSPKPLQVLLIGAGSGLVLVALAVFGVLWGRVMRAQSAGADPLEEPFPDPVALTKDQIGRWSSNARSRGWLGKKRSS